MIQEREKVVGVIPKRSAVRKGEVVEIRSRNLRFAGEKCGVRQRGRRICRQAENADLVIAGGKIAEVGFRDQHRPGRSHRDGVDAAIEGRIRLQRRIEAAVRPQAQQPGRDLFPAGIVACRNAQQHPAIGLQRKRQDALNLGTQREVELKRGVRGAVIFQSENLPAEQILHDENLPVGLQREAAPVGVGAARGAEVRVHGAVGVETSHRARAGNQDFSVGLHGDAGERPVVRGDHRLKRGVEPTVRVQPGDAGTGHPVHLPEESHDDDAPVRLQRQVGDLRGVGRHVEEAAVQPSVGIEAHEGPLRAGRREDRTRGEHTAIRLHRERLDARSGLLATSTGLNPGSTEPSARILAMPGRAVPPTAVKSPPRNAPPSASGTIDRDLHRFGTRHRGAELGVDASARHALIGRRHFVVAQQHGGHRRRG